MPAIHRKWRGEYVKYLFYLLKADVDLNQVLEMIYLTQSYFTRIQKTHFNSNCEQNKSINLSLNIFL